jgi:hypothetical protein
MNALSQAKHRAWVKMVRGAKGPAQIRQALGALITTFLDAAKKQATSEKDVRKGPSKGAEYVHLYRLARSRWHADPPQMV